MQSWTPNTPLQNGQYIIQRAIGGGGFGETYLAEGLAGVLPGYQRLFLFWLVSPTYLLSHRDL